MQFSPSKWRMLFFFMPNDPETRIIIDKGKNPMYYISILENDNILIDCVNNIL